MAAVIAAWLPALYPWASIDAADIATIALTLMATIVASAAVLVCVLTIIGAAHRLDLAGRPAPVRDGRLPPLGRQCQAPVGALLLELP